MKIKQAIEKYLEEETVTKSLVKYTLYQKKHCLANFFKGLEEVETENLSFDHLKPVMIEWKARISLQSYSNALHTVKPFTDWLFVNHFVDVDPLWKLLYPRVPRRLPSYLGTKKEILQIASFCDPTTPNGIRDRAMILVCYSGALRSQELLDLTLKRYLRNRQRPALHVVGIKQENDRYVLLMPEAHAALERYLVGPRDVILAGRKDTGWLFIGGNGGKVSKTVWQRTVKSLGAAANVPLVKLTPHVFRHSMATQMANAKDSNFFRIMAYLGHRSPMSTMTYVHMIDRDTEKFFANTFGEEAVETEERR